MYKKNSIQVLGAYGTKAKGFGTTSFMLNPSTVIDAGNLLSALQEKSMEVESIFLTHSHLDHISDIAYIIDNYFYQRTKTLKILGLPQTIEALKTHFLNDIIWPDFSKIKLESSDVMAISYEEVHYEKEYMLEDETSLMPFQTDHTVPSCGYIYKKNENAVLITADTYALDNVIKILNAHKYISALVVECSFPSNMQTLAQVSKHLTPKLLFEALQKLKRDDISLYIHHMKPSSLEKISEEVDRYKGSYSPILLKDGDFITF